MFQDALARRGDPPARVVAWAELVRGPGALADAIAATRGDVIVRIDSAGEDDDVERALIVRGEAAARADGRCAAIDAAGLAAIPRELGRILYPRQHHHGFLAVLGELDAALADARADRGAALRVVQPPAAIAPLFDKAVTSAAWHARGIPVPDVLPGGPVHDPDDLRARMDAAGWRNVYVKLTSGSSASCLAVFQRAPRGGESVITTIEDTGDARYNTRRLQRLGARARIDRTLGFILAEGAQVERAIPKARTGDRYFDLRVLAIDGEVGFVVVRTSPHPITNLHLGGLRGDAAAVRAELGDAAWDAALASCVAVQRASGAFHVGVDCMFEAHGGAHRIIEGNAFGDLLPNLERDGLDVYGWQIARIAGTHGATR